MQTIRNLLACARQRMVAFLPLAAFALLAGCGGGPSMPDMAVSAPPQVGQAPVQPVDANALKVGLILPLSATGNAGMAAQSLKNAAEMALAESGVTGIQLVVKDDAGTAPGAQAAAQSAIDEGARVILGPLFAHTVSAAGQVARARGVPLIGFSTDTNVATRGVYLLSFLPESDVERVVRYAVAHGKRSFAALVPDNAYGSVVEAALQQAAASSGARVVALERYPMDKTKLADPVRRIAASAAQADTLFLPDAADTVPQIVQQLSAAGVNVRSKQLVGTGLWNDPRLFADPAMAGGWFAAPDSAGYANFSQRYRARYGQPPVRTAALAHDAVSLVAAIVKSQGPMAVNDQTLTNPSGFNGVDGVFRFKQDGTNERGLAVMQIDNGTARVVEPALRSFGNSGY